MTSPQSMPNDDMCFLPVYASTSVNYNSIPATYTPNMSISIPTANDSMYMMPQQNMSFDDNTLSRSASIASSSEVQTPESQYATLVSQPQQPAMHFAPAPSNHWMGSVSGLGGYPQEADWSAGVHHVDFPIFNSMINYSKPASNYAPVDSGLYSDGMNMAANFNPRSSFSGPVPTTMASPMMPPTSPLTTTYSTHSMYTHQAPVQTFVTYPQDVRRQSVGSPSGDVASDDNSSHQKQTCPQCNKKFKDLKAHKLTHQEERPEKCPIPSCDYHIKGFSRRYDRNRHTLTHYKGNMICGFCPGSGSTNEKTFNRADVFKRHLTAVHGVEQTPPNSRRRGSGAIPAGSAEQLTGYADDATGQCSTCPRRFRSAQDFYEHLDECVLRIVQQEDPAEANNAKCLASVENDSEVVATLERNKVPMPSEATMNVDDDYSEDEQHDHEHIDSIDPSLLDGVKSKATIAGRKKKTNPANGVQKSHGMTHSRGGVPQTQKKGRKPRREYPTSWGYDKGQMKMKKRVLTCFEGARRIAKDDLLLNNDHEVRVPIADNMYVTDLDVHTMRRAAGWLSATEEEKGPWVSDDPTDEQRVHMQFLQMQQQNHQTEM